MAARPEQDPTPGHDADGRLLLARIRHMGRTLDDLENLRIRHENRRGAFERDYDIVLPPDDVSVLLGRVENEAKLDLVRLWRTHPLAGWAKDIRGVGEKSVARLIAEIGDPAARPNPAKLWAYCGYDPNRRRRKGMSQEDALGCGNPRAKKQVWLIATRMLMSGNRDLYDRRRAATAGRDWTDGHKHNDALRIVGKAFLRDLWVAARASQSGREDHTESGGAGT